MPITIEVIGLKELRRRMRQFPQKYNQAVKTTLSWSLHKLWSNVPPYPPKPTGSTYDRKGILGKSLGSSEGGGKAQGEPDIFVMYEHGGNVDNAEFGTRLNYAPFVLGERQASHMGHWWTMKKLAKKTKPDIIKAFKKMALKLAQFLEGKGML